MTSASSVVIIGAGGHAREVLDILAARREAGDTTDVLGYLVDPHFASAGTIVNGLPVLGGLDWLKGRSRSTAAVCAIGAPEVRRAVVERASNYDVGWVNVIHPSVIKSRWVTIGSGVVIAAGCVLTNRIEIGHHAHLNVGCTIAHDVEIADYVTLSPGVHVSGNVNIGMGAFVGVGASIVPRRHLGEWSITGAGAVVSDDIPPNATAVGVPAKVIKTRPSGWHLEL